MRRSRGRRRAPLRNARSVSPRQAPAGSSSQTASRSSGRPVRTACRRPAATSGSASSRGSTAAPAPASTSSSARSVLAAYTRTSGVRRLRGKWWRSQRADQRARLVVVDEAELRDRLGAGAAARERLARDEHELLPEQERRADPRERGVAGHEREREVELVREQLLAQLRVRAVEELHLDLRVRGGEAREEAGEGGARRAEEEPEAHQSVHLALGVHHELEGAGELGVHAAEAARERRAFAGQDEPAPDPVEQPHAQRPLETRHALADGRAGERERRRGGADPAALGDRQEGAQLVQVHAVQIH